MKKPKLYKQLYFQVIVSIFIGILLGHFYQALNIDLSLWQQLTIIAVLLLTSKGAAAITGGGFIVLTATLSSMHTIPVEGVVLLLGVDRFMSEARSLTNLIGNGVATIVIAKWDVILIPMLLKRLWLGSDVVSSRGSRPRDPLST